MKYSIVLNNGEKSKGHQPLTIGVTGTKGKTSTVHYIAQLMEYAGLSVAMDSTVSCRFKAIQVAPCTNMEDVLHLMRLSRHLSVDCVVLEVTSRVATLAPLETVCQYDCAVFTTLAPEHLDYHRSMRNYLSAKKRLFSAVRDNKVKDEQKWAVLNRDDPHWESFLTALDDSVKTATYSVGVPVGEPVSKWDYKAKRIVFTDNGTTFDLHLPNGTVKECRTPLYGLFNVSNILAAATCALSYGISLDHIVSGMERVSPPPGRLEIVQRGNDDIPWIIVDFAHTAESLAAALRACRGISPRGKVVCIFGCGGDCYKAKRPRMGSISATLADRVILTSDNPRHEDPLKIIQQIRRGIPAAERDRLVVEPDRKRAIVIGVSGALGHDVVLIAGKGPEKTQTIGDVPYPFSDPAIALGVLRENSAQEY